MELARIPTPSQRTRQERGNPESKIVRKGWASPRQGGAPPGSKIIPKGRAGRT